jgi:hypothetical protein
MDGDVFIKWIEDALEQSRQAGTRKTKAGVAAALGRTPAQATRLLDGTRRLQAEEISKIARYLETPPPSGFAEDAASFEGKPQDLAPIFRVSVNNSGDWLLHRHEEPIDLKPRAPHFINSAKVFGFYAPDDLMAPRFKPGETVWVDPARPPKPGDEVVLVRNTTTRGPEQVILAELRAQSKAELKIAQYKDQTERAYEKARWTALLVLPRY